ncbi:toprim domain-containing protein [Pseudomonas sp. 5P_3.1_Bac2]|uniref:toprim domain-containing protein n=1 Tax=Pseudomonas sp. 5P_3.1_Bac2 TaxID=2971617 RepID=UPI0021C9EC4A|nr:toprim domain-containing protein [Pseudomonas sp. 5P_3.1_Bac2]MCU1718856.1 toprim domain-containing protein [Pseudomonas sp. 5P_3.1_Bac2]
MNNQNVANATTDSFGLDSLMGPVARHLLGEPNAVLSKASELRFGNHGSLAVDLNKGVWHDHECGVGGGVFDLISRETGIVTRSGQLSWLEKCGLKEPQSKPVPVRPKVVPKPKIETTYAYEDEKSQLLFEVVRFDPKDFRQRKPDGKGGWIWSVKGVRQIPYRLPQLLDAPPEQTVFVVEGEKDVLSLESLGLVATCNAGGAGKWPDTFNEHFIGRSVVILADNDEPGRKHASKVAANLNLVTQANILCLPNLPPKGDVSDWLDAGGTVEQLLQLMVAPDNHLPKYSVAVEEHFEPSEDEKQSQASQLVKFVEQRFELFHDQNKDVFTRDRKTGEVRGLGSRQFRDCLLAGFYIDTGKSPRDQSTREALSTLAGLGRFQGEFLQVHLRTAGSDGEYFLDLAAPGSSRAVRIQPGAWKIVESPTAMFVRPESMQPLPDPVAGGSIDALWRVANIPTGFRLLALTWLVECLRPDTPYPVAELLGEQGSGKSGTQTALRGLFDPNACNLRGAPKSVEDIFVSANACPVLSYENVSHLPAPMQDALCVLATGGGYAKRKLYSDCEESIISVKRPIILNGISACVTAQDLVDRTITIETPVITERLEVTELWREYEAERPRLLGALLDIAAKALELLPAMRIPADERPRLVEFARLGMAVAAAVGHKPADFIHEFNASRTESLSRTIDASPVAAAVVDMVEARPLGITAPVKEILLSLEQYRPTGCDSWPKSPKGLGDALRRAAPALRQTGIECKCLGKVGSTVKWEIKRNLPTPSRASREVVQDEPVTAQGHDMTTFTTSNQEVSFDEDDMEAF